MSLTPASRSQNVPYLLQGAEGNLVWKDGEIMENAAGAAAIGFASISVLDSIAKNEGNITVRDLGLIKELVKFIQPDTMNSFRKGFKELSQQPTPSGGLSNPFLPKEEEATQSQPVNHSPSSKVPAEPPKKRTSGKGSSKKRLVSLEDSDAEGTRSLVKPIPKGEVSTVCRKIPPLKRRV
ncbi:hypothetical protein THAR02_09463 [Trichoderma harzianum]|uniref:Uncharacterized protein n=1 Tax=Trichoderma harzianum TaxID=5544 RepID=A0A0F9ZDF2_TRIHA|nr:hypothetical protein THAR02_09463 [Trichoderma harzianum]